MKKQGKGFRVYGKNRQCKHCGEEFQLTAPNKIYCSKECKDAAYNVRKAVDKKKSTPKQRSHDHLRRKIEQRQRAHDFHNGVTTIKKIMDIGKDVIEHMDILKLEMYSQKTQDYALEMMQKIHDFLGKQLKTKGGVIIIDETG